MTEGTDEILRRLDMLVRLFATVACADRPQKEKIDVLDTAGLSPKEIAEFLGTTPNTVSVYLSAIRKEKLEKGTRRPRRSLETGHE